MPRKTTQDLFDAINAQTDAITALANAIARQQQAAPAPAPVKEAEPKLAKATPRVAPAEDQLGSLCKEFGLNRDATAATIRKFERWCRERNASKGEYTLYVLRSGYGRPSLRWFRKQPTTAVAAICTS